MFSVQTITVKRGEEQQNDFNENNYNSLIQ